MSGHAFQDRIAARKSRFAVASLLTVLALALAACAPASPAPAAAPTAVGTEVLGSTQQPSATMAAPGAAMGPATVMVSSNGTLGKFLVDSQGMTQYLFTKDTKNTSNCYDKCAQVWPPLLTKGAPVASTGADSSLLGVTTRKDGSQQVTYNGAPLYYYAPDKQPGDTLGQNVGGVWFVMPPTGQMPSGGSAAPQPTATSAASAAASGGYVAP